MSVQFDLFGAAPKFKPERKSEQQRQLERVQGRIGPVILDWLRDCGVGETFRAEDLHSYVRSEVQAAPASADRILRALRRDGFCDYVVLDRRASLYRITALS